MLRLQPIAQGLHDNLALVCHGWQPILDIFLNRVEIAVGLLRDSAKQLSEDFQCLPLVTKMNEGLEILKKERIHFGPMVSKAQREELQVQVKTFIQAPLNQMMAITTKAQQKLMKTIKVPPAKEEHVRLCGSILVVIEKLFADLWFFMKDKVVADSELARSIPSWLTVLSAVSNDVFKKMSQGKAELAEAVRPIFDKRPSILQFLEETWNLIRNDDPTLKPVMEDEFTRTIDDAVTLVELVRKCRADLEYTQVDKLVDRIANLFVDRKPLEPVVSEARRILCKSVNEILSNDLFVGYPNGVKEMYNTLVKTMNGVEKGGRILQIEAVICVCRLFALVGPDFERSESIMQKLFDQISVILNHLIGKSKEMANEVHALYHENYVPFDERELVFLCYHISILMKQQSLDKSSKTYLNSLRKVLGYTGCLPRLILKTADSCQDVSIQKKLREYHKTAMDSDLVLRMFSHQLLLILTSDLAMRSEVVASILTFKMGSEGFPDELSPVIRQFYLVFETSHPYLVVDDFPTAILKAVSAIKDCVEDYGIHEKVLSGFLPGALSVIRQVIGKDTIPLRQLVEYCQMSSPEEFVAAVGGYVSQLISLIKTKALEKPESALPFICSEVCTCGKLVRCIIKESPTKVSSELESLTNLLNVSLDVLSHVAFDDASSMAPVLLENGTLLECLEQMLSIVDGMPQPYEEVKLPEELKEMRKVQATTNDVPNGLKVYAEIWIQWLKDKSAAARAQVHAQKWLKATQAPNANPVDAGSKLVDAIFATPEKDPESKGIWEGSVDLSVSLAQNISSFPEEYASQITQKHHELYECLHELLLGSKNTRQTLLKILHVVATIVATAEVANMAEPEYHKELIRCYYNAIQSIDGIRKDAKNGNLIMTGVRDLSRLLVGLSKSGEPVGNDNLSPLLTTLISGNINTKLINDVIALLAKGLCELVPNVYYILDDAKSELNLLDLLYTKLTDVQENSSDLPERAAVPNCSLSVVFDMVRVSVQALLEVPAIAWKLLPRNRSVMESCLEETAFILESLSPFVVSALEILSSPAKSVDELRKLSRRLTKSVSNLIDMVETRDKVGGDRDELSEAITSCLCLLFDALFAVNAPIVHGSISVCPEMFENRRVSVEKQFGERMNKYSSAIETVRNRVVGRGVEELDKLIPLINSELRKLAPEVTRVTFTPGKFPVQSCLESLAKLGAHLRRLAVLSRSLTDQVVIPPDPLAADSFADFRLPVIMCFGKTLAASYEKFWPAEKELLSSVAAFEEVLSKGAKDNSEIVKSIGKVSEVAFTFCECALRIILGSFDPDTESLALPDVEKLKDAIISTQSATRNCLLRTTGFNAKLEQSLNELKSAITQMAETMKWVCRVTECEPEEKTPLLRAIQHGQYRGAKLYVALRKSSIPESQESVPEDFEDKLGPDQFGKESVGIDTNEAQKSLKDEVFSRMIPIVRACQSLSQRLRDSSTEPNRGGDEKIREFTETLDLMAIAINGIRQDDEMSYFKLTTAAVKFRNSARSVISTMFAKERENDKALQLEINTVLFHIGRIVEQSEKICQNLAHRSRTTTESNEDLEKQLARDRDALIEFQRFMKDRANGPPDSGR